MSQKQALKATGKMLRVPLKICGYLVQNLAGTCKVTARSPQGSDTYKIKDLRTCGYLNVLL